MGRKDFFQILGKLLGKEKREDITASQKADSSEIQSNTSDAKEGHKNALARPGGRDLPEENPNKGKGLFDSEEERAAALEKVRQEMRLKAKQENGTYDPTNDPEVSRLLQSLSEGDKAEFFRVRENSLKDRRDDETLSQREMDILTLRAMKRSYAFSAVTSRNVESIRWDDMPAPSAEMCRELTFPEVLLLSKIRGISVKKFQPAGYFTHDYHLDLNESIKTMFASGLICYADFKTCLEAMTMKELKEILAECSLAVGGKKSVLVERITANCDPAVWEKRIDRRVMLTDAGRELIAKNDVLIYCQNNIGLFSISPDEAGGMRKEHPDWSMYQIVRFILEKRGTKFLATLDYGLYRNTLYGISQTYRHEGIVEQEKCYVLQCCFMDAVGYGNGNRIEKRLAMLAPALLAELSTIHRRGQLSLDNDYCEALKRLPISRTTELERQAYGEIKKHLEE